MIWRYLEIFGNQLRYLEIFANQLFMIYGIMAIMGNFWYVESVSICQGSLNVPIEHHPTIRYMIYNGYYKVMSNIPKMGNLPTPVCLPTYPCRLRFHGIPRKKMDPQAAGSALRWGSLRSGNSSSVGKPQWPWGREVRYFVVVKACYPLVN